MKDLIKIIISLAFMAVSFFVGSYLANEKCAIQLKDVNEQISVDKNRIQSLQDSIGILKQTTDTISARKQIPISKKQIISNTKANQQNDKLIILPESR